MDLKNNKTNIIIISGVMALILTAFFLVANITALFITAYVFGLFGIALLCFGKIHMIDNPKSYPWYAAFPITIFRYLVAQLSLSVVFVLVENIIDWTLPMQWFLLLHILLLSVFTILLLSMRTGKDIIEETGDKVKAKVTTLRFMQVDVESLARKFPEHEAELKKVVESIRYSDPMSHDSLAIYDEQIQRGIMAMNDGENIPMQCEELLRQIADRNARVKILK